MNDGIVLFMIYDRIINGANFCQVARIMHDIHDIAVITDGNQKWNGTMPNFSIIDDNKMMDIWGNALVDQWAILDINISLDPRAWAMKYLIEASVSWFVFVLFIRGINLSILISIDIHKNIQFVLDAAIIVLMISEDIISSVNGLFV